MIKSSVEFNNTEYHNTTIQLKHATAAELSESNPILQKGEMAIETDTNKFKFGDGATLYNGLPYVGGGESSSAGFKYGEYALSDHQTTQLSAGNYIKFNTKLNGSLPDPVENTITLPAGKTYKINMSYLGTFSSTNDYSIVQLYNLTDAVTFGMQATCTTLSANMSASDQPNITAFITTTKDTQIAVKIMTVLNNTMVGIVPNYTRFFIEEYAGY